MIIKTLRPERVKGRRYPAGALISPPRWRAEAMLELGQAELALDVDDVADVVFRLVLAEKWRSGSGYRFKAWVAVDVPFRELTENPAVVASVAAGWADPERATQPATVPRGRPPKLPRAITWLKGRLSAGPVGLAELRTAAGRARISERTLRRAISECGARVDRKRNGGSRVVPAARL